MKVKMNIMKSRYFKHTMLAWLVPVLFLAACDKQPIGPDGPDPIGPVPPGTYLSFKDFRALYPGSGNFSIPNGTKKIRGVVISNANNEAAGNFRLEDESGYGIYLYSVVGSPVYSMGSVLEIDASGGGVLNLFNGDLELKSVPQAHVVPVSGSIAVTARPATIAQINANKDAWASTLVKISNVTSITMGSSNASGINYNVTDATGTIVVFVRTASGITVNTAATSVTGYVSIYNSSAEIGVRTSADFQ
jgi:hypothetical protein